MPGRTPQEHLAILERRKAVTARYLDGQTQWEIARALEVSQALVSKDLKAIRQEWLKESVSNFGEAKAKELAKIDRLERMYLQAWEESRKPLETTFTERNTGDDDANDHGKK